MKIKRNENTWEIEASTRDEMEHLEFLFLPLEQAYARLVSTADSSQANHLLPEGQTQCKAVSG
jgi:hypothetical protein